MQRQAFERKEIVFFEEMILFLNVTFLNLASLLKACLTPAAEVPASKMSVSWWEPAGVVAEAEAVAAVAAEGAFARRRASAWAGRGLTK